MKVEVLESAIAAFCDEWKIAVPSIKVEQAENNNLHGTFSPPHRITLYVGLTFHETNRLPFVRNEINRTLLHELRHAWQYTWRKDIFRGPLVEPDAIDFERKNSHRYHLIRVTRQHAPSRFSRLGDAERRVRPSA